jgi:hypothetical protein
MPDATTTFLDREQPKYAAEIFVMETSAVLTVYNPVARDLRPRKTTGSLVPLETEGALVIIPEE